MASLPPAPGQMPSAPLPVVGQNSAPGQPPPGDAGGAAMPTSNPGAEASAKQKMIIVVKILERALQDVGSDSDIGQTILAALKPLGKVVMPGDEQSGTVSTEMKSLMQSQAQQAPMIAALKQRMAGAASGAGAPPQPMAA